MWDQQKNSAALENEFSIIKNAIKKATFFKENNPFQILTSTALPSNFIFTG